MFLTFTVHCSPVKSVSLLVSVSELKTGSDPYLCVAVVGVPAGSKALLSSDIPNQEVCFTYGDLLHVAADGW